MNIMEWVVKFLEGLFTHARVTAIIFGFLFSWGLTQWLKMPLARYYYRRGEDDEDPMRMRAAQEFHKWITRTIATLSGFGVSLVLWPPDNAPWRYRLIWAGTVGLLSPVVYSILMAFIGKKWPWLTDRVSAAAAVTPEKMRKPPAPGRDSGRRAMKLPAIFGRLGAFMGGPLGLAAVAGVLGLGLGGVLAWRLQEARIAEIRLEQAQELARVSAERFKALSELHGEAERAAAEILGRLSAAAENLAAMGLRIRNEEKGLKKLQQRISNEDAYRCRRTPLPDDLLERLRRPGIKEVPAATPGEGP